MLILSRKVGQRVHIGDEVVVTVVGLRQGQVRLGIDAPPRVLVHREELLDRLPRAGGHRTLGAEPEEG